MYYNTYGGYSTHKCCSKRKKNKVFVYLQQTDSSCYDVNAEEKKYSVLGIFLVFNNHSSVKNAG